jgi:hypothetical protein
MKRQRPSRVAYELGHVSAGVDLLTEFAKDQLRGGLDQILRRADGGRRILISKVADASKVLPDDLGVDEFIVW